MNFLDEVLSLVRSGGSLENLGRGLARVLHHGRLGGFIFYAPAESCLLTVPYAAADSIPKIRREFETRDWTGRPLEALRAAFEALGVATGEVGEEVRWSLLGPQSEPLGIFACVRDPQAGPMSEAEDKSVDFLFQVARKLAVHAAQPLTEVPEAHQGLAGEKTLLHTLLSALEEGVLISDGGGRIVLASPAAQAILALGGEASGCHSERNAVTLRPFFTWLRERWLVNISKEEAEYILPTHPPSLLALTISPLCAGNGEGGHVTVVRDVTEERVRDAARQDGAVRIAAEIEPSLASLRAAFRLLAPQGIDRFESIARRGIDRLAALAEDLRDHALLDRDSLDMDTEDIAIESVVEGAVASVRDLLAEKKIACAALPTAGGPMVRADRRYLARMLQRIFAAVARWTAEGGWIRPCIEWTCGAMEFSLAFLKGPEFPVEVSVEPGTDLTRGVGVYDACNTLGLDVARRVAEKQGGRLAIQDCGGREVKLILELPAAGAPQGVPAAEAEAKDGATVSTHNA